MPQQAPGDDNVGRMQFLLALRKRGIGDAAVLRAMDQVPREHFVESNFVESAYSDQALPIPCGQTISQPYVVAYMTEQLRVEPQHRILEDRHWLGVSGRHSLAPCAKSYFGGALSDSRRSGSHSSGAPRLRQCRVACRGWSLGAPDAAPFDRIMVTAAAEKIPDDLLAQLAEGGLMVLPLGPHGGSQQLVKVTRKNLEYEQEDLIGVRFVPLLPGKAREL